MKCYCIYTPKLLHTHTGLNRTDAQAQLTHAYSLAPSLICTSPRPTGNTADAPPWKLLAELPTRERQKCENAGKRAAHEPQLPFFFLVKKATECGGHRFPPHRRSPEHHQSPEFEVGADASCSKAPGPRGPQADLKARRPGCFRKGSFRQLPWFQITVRSS